jgi:rRNA maturation endonuclease Nob1
VAIAALLYTLAIRPQDVPDPIPASPIQHLEDRKYAIYDNLRDLQFEYRLGKLSDSDYQATKQALQRELAVVLAETEATVKRLGLTTARAQAAKPAKKPSKGAKVCPHCGAKFPTALKFCGECGKAIA